MLEIWYVRHGETDWNKEKRWQGQSDVPLNAAGLEQTRSLARRLGHQSFDLVFASDLARAHLTAATVFPARDIRPEPRLREMNFGIFEGKAWADLAPQERSTLQTWWKDPYHQRLQDGESFQDMEQRVLAWRHELPTSARVAAFTHGGPIRSMLWHITGPPQNGSWTIQFDNTSITRVIYSEERTTIMAVNDCAHLEDVYQNTIPGTWLHVPLQ